MELALTAIVVAGVVFGIWDCISRYKAVNEQLNLSGMAKIKHWLNAMRKTLAIIAIMAVPAFGFVAVMYVLAR